MPAYLASGGFALMLAPDHDFAAASVNYGGLDDETARAELIPGSTRSATMAVTIEAPPFPRVALAGPDGNGSRRLLQLGPSR
ncbi:hypothetical protein SAMN04487913_106153 [Arthrobacter sp. ok362]|jgi:hypothetical protein|nr:hypothetical protein SAMN04487913_106153 [Arthrobacter sp. ok362]